MHNVLRFAPNDVRTGPGRTVRRTTGMTALWVTTALTGVLSPASAAAASALAAMAAPAAAENGVVVVSPGDVVISSDSASTTQDDSPAILGQSAGGSVTITSGRAETSGDRSAGIIGTTASDTGDVRIESDTVVTSGDGSGGIIARAPGSVGDGPYGPTAFGNAVVTSGSVETSGEDATGIFAEALTAVASVSSEAVVTRGDGAAGIVANGGVYTVVTSGSVTTTGVDATGIVATASQGAVVVDSGQVVTAGDGAAGIVAEGTGPVFVRSDSVVTTGDPVATQVTPYYTVYGPAAAGIVAKSSQSGVTIESGTIATAGLSATGILAEARGPVVITSGAIETTGFGARGIDALSEAGPVLIASESVAIRGDNAEGINAVTGAGRITITSGTVTTDGTFSAGIRANGGGSITITSANVATTNGGSAGIDAYSTAGDITITSGTITTASENSTGIRAAAVSPGGDIAIRADAIDTAGLTSDAINVYAGGSIDVDAGVLHTRGEQAAGVFATAYDAVRITADEIITEGPLSAGISALAYGGTVDISVGSVVTSGDSSVGVYGGGFGDVTITADSVVTSGDRLVRTDSYTGQAIYYESPTAIAAYSYSGDVVVSAGTVATSGYGSQGISTYSVFGSTTVTVGTLTVTGAQSTGIRARGGLGAVVIADVVETTGAGIDAGGAVGETMIRANRITTTEDRAEGASVVSLFGAGTVETGEVHTLGDYSSAIRVLIGGATGYSDDGAVFSGEVTTRGDHSRGIWSEVYVGSAFVESGEVRTEGYDAAGILVTAGANIAISSGTVSTSGDASDAISATSQLPPFGGTPGAIAIASESVVTSGDSSRGIVGIGPANVTITSGSVETRGGTAILSSYELVIDENGNYSYELVRRPGPNSVGILAQSGDGVITITSGSVRTAGRGAHGIQATTAAGGITITSGAIAVAGMDANAIEVASQTGDVSIAIDGAIRAARGTGVRIVTAGNAVLAVENGGSVLGAAGRFAVSAQTAATELTIAEGGTVRGAIKLGEGDDAIANAGLFDARETSLFGGGTDLFVNSGRLRAVAGETRFEGLESLRNSGLVTLVDGQADDHLILADTAFVALTGSGLALDVVAGADGTLTVDQVTLGDTSGTTRVALSAQGAATLDSRALIITSSGSLAADAFVLDPATADAGFLRYRLVAVGDNRIAVATAPDVEVFELAALPGLAAGQWQRSADAWSNRIPRPGAEKTDRDRGGWMQALAGDRTLSDRSYRAVGADETFVQSLTTQERFEGVQLGGDVALGQGYIGATGGYLSNRITLARELAPLEARGLNAGVYGGWSNGGAFVAGLAKVDLTRFDLRPTAGLTIETLDTTSIGLQVEGGWRFGGARLYVEPAVAVSWTSSNVDDLNTEQGAFAFDTGQALRVKGGVRLGGAHAIDGQWRLSPSLGVYAVHGSQGDKGLTFRSGSQSLAVAGGEGPTYARFEGGVELSRSAGFSASLSGEVDTGGDVSGYTARAGVAWRW